jgi:PAS domain S-box-containing protein
MSVYTSVFISPLLLSAALSIWLGCHSWRRRAVAGATSLSMITAAVALWSLGYALEIAVSSLEQKLFWATFQYPSIVALPVAWLLCTLQYTRRSNRLTRRMLLLAIVPIITVLLVLTNKAHGLIWSVTTLDASGPFLALRVVHGPWFWVHLAYAYLLLLLGTGLIIRDSLIHPPLYRRQTATLLAAALVPWIGNALYLAHLTPIPHLDNTPFSFALSGMLLGMGLFGFRLFDLLPIARVAVLEHMRDGVVVLDRQGRLTDINPAAAAMLACIPAQVLSRPAATVLDAQFSAALAQRDDADWAGAVSIGINTQRRDLEVRASLLRDRQGRPIGRLLVLRDVTAGKRAKQRLRDQSETIAEQHRRLQLVISAIRDGILLIGPDRRVLVLNNAAMHLLSLPGRPEEWMDRPISEVIAWLEQHAPAAAAIAKAEVARIEREDQQPGSGQQAIGPYIVRWQHLPVQPGSMRLGRMIVLHDATDEAQLERMREDLTHTMVHDLRNPLTAIQGSLDAILYHHGLEQEVHELVEIAGRASRRMLGLINAILDLSRLESGQMPLSSEPVVLPELVAEIFCLLHPLSAARHLGMRLEVQGEPPHVWADPSLISRVLQNLIGNAIKFTNEEGVISVTIGAMDERPDFLQVSVHDSGAGIPSDVQNQLFQKFMTGSNHKGGSGLGLAFCRLVIEAHGGQVWLDRQAGPGTMIRFTLPTASNHRSVGAVQ